MDNEYKADTAGFSLNGFDVRWIDYRGARYEGDYLVIGVSDEDEQCQGGWDQAAEIIEHLTKDFHNYFQVATGLAIDT